MSLGVELVFEEDEDYIDKLIIPLEMCTPVISDSDSGGKRTAA